MALRRSMNPFRRLVAIAAVVLFLEGPMALAQEWKPTSFHTTPKGEAIFSLSISFTNTSDHKETQTITSSAIETIDTINVADGRAAVLGSSGNVSVVEIIDIATSTRSDWFFCYQPYFFGSRWIAFVQYYPNHAVYSPTDVLRVYDLDQTPIQNRYGRAPGSEKYPSQVGIAVYPAGVPPADYSTEAHSAATALHILGSPPFLFLASKRLVFLAGVGADFRELTNQMIAIDFSAGDDKHVGVRTVPLPFSALKRPGINPRFLQVTTMTEVSPYRVRLDLPPSEYGLKGDKEAFVFVDIPSTE